METKINLDKIYEALAKLGDESVNRFLDKLADSPKFAHLVNVKFNMIKNKESYDNLVKFNSENTIKFGNNWELKFNGHNYDLYKDGEMWLSDLDKRLSMKVIRDINVAYLIKGRRIQNEGVSE